MTRRALSLMVVVVLSACGSTKVQLAPGDPAAGAAAYQRECAGCHGADGSGGEGGPAVIDQASPGPGLTDQEIADAIRQGVPAGNGDFGAMPGLRGLDDREISDIVSYVRLLQGG